MSKQEKCPTCGSEVRLVTDCWTRYNDRHLCTHHYAPLYSPAALAEVLAAAEQIRKDRETHGSAFRSSVDRLIAALAALRAGEGEKS